MTFIATPEHMDSGLETQTKIATPEHMDRIKLVPTSTAIFDTATIILLVLKMNLMNFIVQI